MKDIGFDGVDEAVIRREKSKARELRKSRWWRATIAKGICYYCNIRVGAAALTMDHVVPLARGGTSSKNNIVPACKSCNTRKKTLLPLEWEEYISDLRAGKSRIEEPG